MGKTEWGGQEAVRFAKGEHPHRKIVTPNEGWAVSPSFDLQRDGNQQKLEKYLGTDDIEKVEYLRSGIWKSVRLKCGSLITMKSYEQGREKFQSAGKRWIWFDEEPPSDIYEECVVRQEAGIPLDIWITMTPVNGMTWIYDDIYMDTDNPYTFISEAEWDDNPFMEERQKTFMERQIKTEEMMAVRKKGQFVARVGLVCSWWRREKHLHEYTEFPDDWSYYEVLDGGWSDPSAWLLIGIDNDSSHHVVDGFSAKELQEEEIKKRRDDKIGKLIIRSGTIDNDNPRMQLKLASLGMNLLPVQKITKERKSWDEVLAEKLAEYGSIQKGNGEPRLYINKNLKWLVQQIENLKWLEVNRKAGTEIRPKWDDHRKFKHHFDGLYALAYHLISYNSEIQQIDDDIPDDTISVQNL